MQYIDFKRENTNLVIYHANCPDGSASAFSVYYWFKTYHPDRLDRITFKAATYGDYKLPDVTDKNVLICDFSYNYKILCEMDRNAASLLVIDHHISAQLELESFNPKKKIFDMNHSGCYLTWMFFFGTEPPLFLRLIEDYDIWTKKLEGVDQFSIMLQQVPKTFQAYEEFLNEDKIRDTIIQGKALLQYINSQAEKSAKYATIDLTRVGDKFYFVSYINTTSSPNEIADFILKDETKKIDFVALFSYNSINNTTKFCLRSCDNKANVSEIATMYGGGGHRNAAGLTLPECRSNLPNTTLSIKYPLYEILTSGYLIVEKDLSVYHINRNNREIDVLIKSIQLERQFNAINKIRAMQGCNLVAFYHIGGSPLQTYYSVYGDDEKINLLVSLIETPVYMRTNTSSISLTFEGVKAKLF